MFRHFLLCVIYTTFLLPVSAQRRTVSPENRQEKLIAVVPLTGAGTYADPRRPLFAPLPKDFGKAGIPAFTFEASDDGKLAIVEFAAKDRAAFAGLVGNSRVITTFEKSKSSRPGIETELRKIKRNYKLSRPALPAKVSVNLQVAQ